uniref:DNA-damage-inducible protein J n=1 Tax=Candidatus Kentrum sp. DK TaxID=2126562 RepID=A0A450T2N0_9GAMM|nr:MAG: DNA-damage-inducible protein J [Candidatus Kentron sp. DK]
MSETTVIRARISERIEKEATIVLSAMGLTVSDALGILLTRIAHDKAFPFEPLVPNSDTIAAMEEAGLFNSIIHRYIS